MDSKTKVFLKELEELSLKYKIVLSGWLTDCKPSVLGLPGHGDFKSFMEDLRELYLKHMMFIDCFVISDLMVPQTFSCVEGTEKISIDELRLDEMLDFGLVEWVPDLMVAFQAIELEQGVAAEERESKERKERNRK